MSEDCPSSGSSKKSNELVFKQKNGGVVLIRNGYQYTKKKDYKSGWSLWRCSKWRNYCSGSLKIQDNEVIKEKRHQCEIVCGECGVVCEKHAKQNLQDFGDEDEMISTKELIILIKNRPVLWDRNILEFKDKQAKEDGWNEIVDVIQPNGDKMDARARNRIKNQIQKKWYNARDAYAKSLKQNGAKKRTYVYAPLLTFLDQFYFNVQESVDITNENEEDGIEFEENEVYLDMEADEPVTKQERSSVDLDMSVHESPKREEEDNIVSVLANLIQKEEDEDRSFFKSITPYVKDLSDESKLEFRIEVMKLLKTLKKKEQLQFRN